MPVPGCFLKINKGTTGDIILYAKWEEVEVPDVYSKVNYVLNGGTNSSNNPEKYSSIQDIIGKEYTVPLKNFKNHAISRFKETYNLAKNKSGFSVLKSLSLANELLFASNVDPVIIRACKNINELYIYLSCLEDNILNEFRCFKIVYET